MAAPLLDMPIPGTGQTGAGWIREDGYCDHPPRWIILGINNVCNLRCRMCDVGLGDRNTPFWANLIGDHPQNMTLDTLEEILIQGSAFGSLPRIGLAFTEPLIHPEALTFAREIVSRGFHCAITSNGSTLAHLADGLVEIGVNELCISVDGPGPVHNRIRGRSDSFERLYRGVEALNEARRRRGVKQPVLTFSFTITDANYGHILAFLKEVEPLRPDRIVISQLNFVTESMAAAHNAQYHGDLKVTRSNLGDMELASFDAGLIAGELARVVDYAASRGRDFPSLEITPAFTERSRLETYYREPETFVGGRQCTDPWKMMMVKTDGTVIPAHGRCYDFPVGRIQDSPLTALWNSPRFLEFRQTLQSAGGTLPACARCCGCIGKPLKRDAAANAAYGGPIHA